jgi:ATP-binding cassette subfamily B multidrug efflux pump
MGSSFHYTLEMTGNPKQDQRAPQAPSALFGTTPIEQTSKPCHSQSMFGFFERKMDPFPDTRHGEPPKGLVPFVWHYVRDAKPWLIAMTILSALIAIGEVLLFGFMGLLVDWLANTEPTAFLDAHGTQLAWMAAASFIILPIAHFLWGLIVHQVMLGNLPMSARWRMHRYLLGQSTEFYANEYAGRIGAKLMQTALAVREVVMKILDICIYVGVFFVTMIVMIAAADWRLAMPIVLWLIGYSALVWWFVPRLTKISEEQADARSAMTGRIVDSYTNITTVKLFAHARQEEAYARASMSTFLSKVHGQMRLVTLFVGLVQFNNAIALLLIGWVGITFWLAGSVTAGAIAAALALALRIVGMSQWIMWEVSALFENIGIVYDGMDMLAKRRTIEDDPDAKPLLVTNGGIEFSQVSFQYGQAASVITDLSLSIKPGEKLGIVGRSGAGKSTLVNLLLRLYDTEAGKIEIDGTDITDVTQNSLRAQIGMVTQDTSLLHRSIRENIAYGRNDASDADILAALERANAAEFVSTLEDAQGNKGLETKVGERGVKLSGGQRQRIAIARIFLKDAPILVLDEATSALDSEVEATIQEHLFDLMEGKTVMAIAHRLSTIAEMDRLIVLDDGKIIEHGTHDELIAASGLYAELWARQSGGFIGVDETAVSAAE